MYLLTLKKVTQCHCVAVAFSIWDVTIKTIQYVHTYVRMYGTAQKLHSNFRTNVYGFTSQVSGLSMYMKTEASCMTYVKECAKGTDSMSLLKYAFTKQVGVW